MRKAAIGLLALGILSALCGTAFPATHTISWSPVATYTDGTPITGKTVAYSVYWSASASLSSLTMFASGLTQTSKTFDPAALGMTPGATVYFTLRTTASTGESSAYSSPRPWVVPAAAPAAPSPSLSGISIGGPVSVNEGSTGAYAATATWSNGTTSAVAPAWSVSNSYASISSSGTLTAASVSANRTVTVNASYASGGITKTAAKTVTVVNASPSLSGISIGGPASVNEGSTGAYAATATWSNGTTSAVAPAWSVSNAYASISSSGTLTAASVSANRTVTVNASYASGGITKTAAKTVTVVNAVPYGPASPENSRIRKQDSPVPDTWRLSWDPVTTFSNGQALGSGRTVRYNVYWTRDPSLAAGNLVAIATSTTTAYVDFQSRPWGMENNEMVYFALRAILDTGEQSALSGSLPWRVSSKGPAAPIKGRIGKK